MSPKTRYTTAVHNLDSKEEGTLDLPSNEKNSFLVTKLHFLLIVWFCFKEKKKQQ